MAERGSAGGKKTPWWAVAVAAVLGALWYVLGPHGVIQLLDWLSRVGH